MRKAFTMIELIFVIVIIGILAALSLPRLIGIQDDALVASEKAGIGAARSALNTIHGKAIIKGKDFNVTVIGYDGTPGYVTLDFDTTTKASNHLSPQHYPWYISLDANPASSGSQVNTKQEGSLGSGLALALLLEIEGRDEWLTRVNTTNSDITDIKGPASNSIVTDSDAKITTNNHWEYNPTSGTFVLKDGK